MLENFDIFDGDADVYFDPLVMPRLRPATILYDLEPIGVGTGACESLRGYFDRLADSHRVNPTALIEDVIAQHLRGLPGYSIRITTRSKQLSRHFISGGASTESITKVLVKLTGVQELDSCTRLPTRGIIGTRGLIRSRSCHCPLCFQAVKSKPRYAQLLWEVECVTACPIHNIKFVESVCGAERSVYTHKPQKKLLSGVCSKCGSIGYCCRNDTVTTASSVEIWKAQQVAELILHLPKAATIFSQERTIYGLKELVTKSTNGVSAIVANNAGIYKSVLWGWMNGRFPPNLPQLLDICLSTGVSLVSVLKGEPSECECPRQISIIRAKPRKDRASYEERESALRQALSATPSISIAAVARKLKLHRTTLIGQFPELATRIIKRFSEFRKESSVNRRQHDLEVAGAMIKKLRDAGVPCTHRNFSKLTNQYLLPETSLWVALRKLLSEE